MDVINPHIYSRCLALDIMNHVDSLSPHLIEYGSSIHEVKYVPVLQSSELDKTSSCTLNYVTIQIPLVVTLQSGYIENKSLAAITLRALLFFARSEVFRERIIIALISDLSCKSSDYREKTNDVPCRWDSL